MFRRSECLRRTSGNRSRFSAVAALALVGSISLGTGAKAATYPYSITPPQGFKYVMLVDTDGQKVDYYFPSLGSFVTNINIYAVRGQMLPDEQLYLRSIGATQVRRSGWLRIVGRKLPLMRGDFHGLVGHWILEQVSFAGCGLIWHLTVSYDVKYAKLRSSMLRSLGTFRLNCSGSEHRLLG